jgi:hypothetical protein
VKKRSAAGVLLCAALAAGITYRVHPGDSGTPRPSAMSAPVVQARVVPAAARIITPSATCPPGALSADADLAAAQRAFDAWYDDRRYTKQFLGALACPATETMIVYRVTGSTAFDAAARTMAGEHHVGLALVDRAYSHAQLERAMQQIEADLPGWAAKGIEVRSIVIDSAGDGRLRVIVRHHAARAQQLFRAKYGAFVRVSTGA